MDSRSVEENDKLEAKFAALDKDFKLLQQEKTEIISELQNLKKRKPLLMAEIRFLREKVRLVEALSSAERQGHFYQVSKDVLELESEN